MMVPAPSTSVTTPRRPVREALERLAVPEVPPVVNAEWLARQMGRRNLLAKDVATLLDVTPAAIGQWLKGRIPRQRQRELMDLFGAPLSLEEATTTELLQELMRRGSGADT